MSHPSPFTVFSRHAFERLSQRTRLSPEEASSILDRRLFVDVGAEPGFNREHLLFYSPTDCEFYVAIRDRLTGTVVTILTLEFHENIAWRISPEQCATARARFDAAHPFPSAATDTWALKPSVFVISAHYLDENGRQKTTALTKIPAAPFSSDVRQLLEDESLFGKIDEAVIGKGLEPRRVFAVSFRLGNKGTPLAFELHET